MFLRVLRWSEAQGVLAVTVLFLSESLEVNELGGSRLPEFLVGRLRRSVQEEAFPELQLRLPTKPQSSLHQARRVKQVM